MSTNIFSHYTGLILSNTKVSQQSILVSAGEIVPYESGWDSTLGYKNITDTFVAIEPNKSSYARIDTIIGKPNICEISGGYACIDISVIKGANGNNPMPSNEIGSPSMFLGWVFVPAQFPTYPSILCTRSFNKEVTSVIKSEHPSVVLSQILSSVEEWQSNYIYFYGQLVKYNNSIFIALYSHCSSTTLNNDITSGKWQEITSDQQDLSAIIESILINLLPDYIKHPGQPEFSIQFNVQNQFNGSNKLKWNTQFNQIELNGGLLLKNQSSTMSSPTDGINIYTKSSGISPSKHIEAFIVDESGTEITIFTKIV